MAKSPTVTCNGITFNIKAEKPSDSFTDLMKEYLEPAMRKHFLKECGRMQYTIHRTAILTNPWLETNRNFTKLKSAVKEAIELSEKISDIIRIYDYVKGNFVALFANGEVTEVANDREMDVFNAIEAETAEILSDAIEAQNLGELVEQPNRPDVTFDITLNGPCPDCKDGFYYPLFGPKEPCRTCHG